MNRRRWLAYGCAHCALAVTPWARGLENWSPPPRFTRPEVGSDEGGLWAMMDREETRLRRSPFRLRDEALQTYLQTLACRLAGEHCPDIRVYPVRTPYFNASMAPNGMMQVWSGLLLRMDNEAQLATVLAHEIGHFLQRHTLALLRDAKSRSAFATFVGMFGVAGAVAQVAAIAGAFGFSRDQEREADAVGLKLMEGAGYDPREAAKVWDNLVAEISATPGADPAKSPMFATHPPSPERSQTLAELAGGRGGERHEAEYAARLAPLRFDLLGDELSRGRHDETLALLDRMLKREPGLALLLYYRGETRRTRAQPGDAELALADLQAAIGGGQEPAQAHRSLGYLYRSQNQGDASRQAFEHYLEKAPEAADAQIIRQYLNTEKAS
jgi:tetratricopeptide (TPR) repeat protein